MAEFTFRQNTGQQDYTPGVARTAGEVIRLGDNRAAVVKTDLAANEKGAVYTEGIGDVAAATGTTWSDGQALYWDASADVAVTAPGDSDDFYIGRAIGAKTSGPLFGRMDLNAAVGREPIVTPYHEFDHADATATPVELVPAAQNQTGFYVLAFSGEVTEQMAGSSEDQMIITLQDEDDTAASVITAADAAADAAGDLLIGTRTLTQSASGAAIAKIAAGKAVEVVLTQTTAGSPAGKIKVGAVLIPLT